MTAYLMTEAQHAQIVDALENAALDEAGFEELYKALAMLKAMKPQAPVAWVVDGGKKNSMLLPTYAYELELEVPKVMCKPLYALGDAA